MSAIQSTQEPHTFGFRGSKAPSFFNKTIACAAKLCIRAESSSDSLVRSTPSPSRTSGASCAHLFVSSSTFRARSLTVRAVILRLWILCRVYQPALPKGMSQADARAVHKVEGTPFVRAGHLKVEASVNGMVDGVHTEPVAHDKRVAAPFFPEDIPYNVGVF